MTADANHIAIILAMAAVTYLTRILGYWWIGRRPLHPAIRHLLEAVPAAVLVAVIAPSILSGGASGLITGFVTIIAAWRLPMLAVVTIAVATAALSRHFLA